MWWSPVGCDGRFGDLPELSTVTDAHLPRTLPNDATEHTRAVTTRPIPSFDPADFDRAQRGLIAQHDTGVIEGPAWPAWDINRWSFIEQGAPNPDTVHASLWRQAQLNVIHGLFEVAPGCWQARGYDISNITFIEGHEGWVIVDPLTNTATAATFLPVVAVIALTLGQNPLYLAIPAALATNCSYMMPVGTPPNAIVFGSGLITLPEMVRVGWLLNLCLLMIVLLAVIALGPWVFGIQFDVIPEWAR